MDYILHLLILVCIYTLLSQSLNLVAGLTGMVSLSHASFFGIGAYTTAIFSTQFGTSFWLNLPLSMFICAIIAYIISFIALRTIEDYFVICTLGIQIILFSLMNNLVNITNGPIGISSIPSITLMGFSFESKLSFCLLSVFFLIIVWVVLKNIFQSGFGKILIAISEDEIYTESIGKDVHQSKIISFTVSAMFSAIPGALFAHYISYVDPTSFTVSESIFILSIVIIGGLANLFGSFCAAAFLVLLPEFLRFIGLPDSFAANLQQIIYGSILVLMMISRNKYLDIHLRRVKNKV